MAISATSGVVSNIDYKSLLSQLLAVKREPLKRLEQDKSELNDISSAYDQLNTRVLDIKDAADDLRTESAFEVFTADTSDDTIVGVTAGSTAAKGTYDVVVSALAKSHKIAADGVAESTSTISSTSGSFSFTVGTGTEQTVSVDTSTTLEDLRDSINELDAGVTASIINDGDASTPYRLVLTSDETGTTNEIAITQNDTDLAFSTTLQAAQDASFTVDGMSITKSSNTVTDVIEGVTLDLKSADAAETVTVNVSRDTAKIAEKIERLVENYNSMVTYIRSKNRYDTDTKVAGPFFGDVVARSVWEDLRRITTTSVDGLSSDMNRLLHVGITTDTEGKLSLDTSELEDALASNYDEVVDLFIEGDSTTGFGSLMYDKADEITDYADGRIKGRKDGIANNIRSIEHSLRNKEDELASYENMLRDQYTALETMLATLNAQRSFLSSFGG